MDCVVALIEVSAQNIARLVSTGLMWPGELRASTIGASVAGLADGTRWLRLSGTLPHPNVPGGYWLVALVVADEVWAALLYLSLSCGARLAGRLTLLAAGVPWPSESWRRWAGTVIGVAA